MKLGIITYNYPHLKTEQVLLRLMQNPALEIFIYTLPFTPRKSRSVLFEHRPSQFDAAPPALIAKKYQLPIRHCDSDVEIEAGLDQYLILGAGILSPQCVEGKKIINSHPGIIPAARGLDAFKWSIFLKKPLGVTLHYIDESVDAGDLITIAKTPIFETDTIEVLARRHYDNEIDLCSRFFEFLDRPSNVSLHLEEDEARMRMPASIEKNMLASFQAYLDYCLSVDTNEKKEPVLP